MLKILFAITSTFLFAFPLHSQISNEEAFNRYQELSGKMNTAFPEDSFETYKRESFTATQLEDYLSMLYERLELLPYIKNEHQLKIDSYLHSGNWFMQMNLPNETIKSYKLFFKYYEDHKNNLDNSKSEDFLQLRSFAYAMTAYNYEKLSHLDSAATVHKKNIEITQNAYIISYPSAINNYGLYFYWTKKDLDSALIQFNKAFEITKKMFPNHHLLGSIRDNIADVYTDQGLHKKAKPLYKANIEFYQQSKDLNMQYQLDVPRLVSAASQYLNACVALGEIDSATNAFKTIETIESEPTYQIMHRPSTKLELLKSKETYYNHRNDYIKAYQTLSKIERLSDSIFNLNANIDQRWQNVINDVALDRLKLNFKIDQIQKETKITSQRAKLWISSLSSSIVVIVLLFLFLRRQQSIENAKNKQLLLEQSLEVKDLKNQQLNAEVEAKKRDLSDFAINLTQNQEWAQLLAEKLEQLKHTTGRARKNQFEEFEQEIKNKISFDKGTQEFYERLDKLSEGFYKQLRNAYPKLSKTDFRLCSLIRLKIDSHEIATLQNISLSSLNTSRYRLRNKFNLSSEENLDSFIQSL